jgi:hypothetical protein
MNERNLLSRRKLLQGCGAGLAALPFASMLGCGGCSSGSGTGGSPVPPPGGTPYQGTDDQLLDEIQKATFQFFWNETNPTTGQIKDRAYLNGNDTRTMASVAATGFGLSALCIGDARGFGKTTDIINRVRNTLQFLYNTVPNVHGFYYHFLDMNTGQRWSTCELSSIDTSILLCGILTARQYFADAEIQDLATKIYNRVDWPWMLNGGTMFSMGWTPESGFLSGRWDHYCELMMIYLLGIGSPTNAVSPSTWSAWSRPTVTFQGLTYISGNDPLFPVHYSHAWFDFRNKKDAYANYFDNAVTATKAHKLFCLSLAGQFSDYSDNLWGISASDYVGGYTAWGGPPSQGPIDGSIVPCTTGGALPFLSADCMKVLRNIRGVYAPKGWGLYSYVDAFNPLTGWYDTDVLGIDLGVTMVMTENQRSGLIWNTFMKNSEAASAMQKVGFQ